MNEYGIRGRDGVVRKVTPDADSRIVMSDEDYARAQARVQGGVPMRRTVTEQRTDWAPIDPTLGNGEVISGYLVVTGNPADGFAFYGPFSADADGHDAIDWASDNLPGSAWWTAPMHEAD